MSDQSKGPVAEYQDQLKAYKEAADVIRSALSAAQTLTNVLSNVAWHDLKVLPGGRLQVEGKVEDEPTGRVHGPAQQLKVDIAGWRSLQELTQFFDQLQKAWNQMQ